MNKIAILQSQSMLSMTNPQKGITAGGTQRYTLQLAKLLKREKYEVFILSRSQVQCSDFDIEYGRIIVFNLPLSKHGDYLYSKYVYDFCKHRKADFVCYVDLQVAKYYCYPNSIALQHGIGWDGPLKLHQYIKRCFVMKDYLRIAQKFNRIVCVDTNFINWARCYDRNFFKHIGKYIYIPNFADGDSFPYSHIEWNKSDKKVLLYPRRLVNYRGYEIFIEMCETLKKRGYDICPVLAFEENAADDFSKLFEGKVCEYKIIHPKLDEINEEYRNAYLTYVPTIWSEGTSLSAIEAISTGCPVITSDVGGLGNIVIPGLVGDIVSPTVEAFVKATEKVLNNESLRSTWSKNCEFVRDSFLSTIWNQKMLEIINNMQE